MRNRQIDLRITEQATEWLEIIDDASLQDRIAFIAWLKESPRHVGEFLAVAALLREFVNFDTARALEVCELEGPGKSNVVPFEGIEKAPGLKQRARLAKLGLPLAASIVMAMIAAAWFFWNYLDGQRYETAIGEQRSIELPDGSLVFMNARSKVTIRYSDRARNLQLISGEALFKVAPDTMRPFRVDVGSSIVQALGTQFNIYRQPEGTLVSVLEGKVQVSNKVLADGRDKGVVSPTAVDRGQQASIAADGRLNRLAQLNEAEVTAWRRRQLVFRSDRLVEVAAEFNRYNQRPQIRVVGVAARERRLTGIFDADDPESLVLFLSDSDLAVRREGGKVVIASHHSPSTER